MYNPLISIIIPVYNGADYLREAIESAINQTYNNTDIIVVNDGSNDNNSTRNIVLSYGTKVRYFEKENGGVASALNLGVSKMRGEYFSWLSHDDVYLPNKIEEQLAFINQNVASDENFFLFSNYSLVDRDLNIIELSHVKEFNIENILFNIFITRPLINGNTVLFKKDLFKLTGLFDESLSFTQDYDLWFRIAKHTKFYYLNKPLILSRSHPDQGSKKYISFFDEVIDLKEKQFREFGDKEILHFTASKSIFIAYSKIGVLFSLLGGQKAQFPMKYVKEQMKNTNHSKLVLLLFLTIIRITEIQHRRIRSLLSYFTILFKKSLLTEMARNASI